MAIKFLSKDNGETAAQFENTVRKHLDKARERLEFCSKAGNNGFLKEISSTSTIMRSIECYQYQEGINATCI